MVRTINEIQNGEDVAGSGLGQSRNFLGSSGQNYRKHYSGRHSMSQPTSKPETARAEIKSGTA
jgi:hypothetical protein